MIILKFICYFLASIPFLALVYSQWQPERRIWPLQNPNTLSLTLTWIITIVAFGSVLVLGILNWNAFGWPLLPRVLVGGGLILVGNILAFSGMYQLGTRATSGAEVVFIKTGLYQYSRNPQYIGDIMIVVGWVVLSASILVLPGAVLLVLAALLAPFVEELWLSGVYGEAYDLYKTNTRRFL